jgi:DNA primase
MNCASANATDLVDYLSSLGHQPAKIRNNDYWYLSPLRDESEPSFKVNRAKNVWFDHGIGCGGKAIDFVMHYFNCPITEALNRISLFHRQNLPGSVKKSEDSTSISDVQNLEGAIKIISLDEPITDAKLLNYLEKRKILVETANAYCKQASYALYDKTYTALGFKNTAGGYELRSEYFKGSTAPKYVTYFDNKANKITVFEGFFDFLTHQSIHQKEGQHMTNFLILNSLSFFERSLLLMEKHDRIHLYLDHDNAGRKCTKIAEQRSSKFIDESKFYKGHKDFNEWIMNREPEHKKAQSLSLRI